jgi:hypothetical protein
MKRLVSPIGVIIVLLLIFLVVPFTSAQNLGCCINDQTGFPDVSKDVTCNDIPKTQCPEGSQYVVNAACNQIPECGCCVGNPDSSDPQVYAGGLTTSSFCRNLYPDVKTKIIPFTPLNQCSAVAKGTPQVTTGINGTLTGSLRAAGIGIAGRLVILKSSQGNFENLTKQQGIFIFNKIPVGDYNLEVEGCGYKKLNQKVTNTKDDDIISLNLEVAPQEGIIIDSLDENNNLISGVSFTISPSINSNIPLSKDGKSTVSQINSNCEYEIIASYQGKILKKNITLSSEDATNFNSVSFKFVALPDECLSTQDCRGPDGVLGEGTDCPHFCSGVEQCEASTGKCVQASNLNCCEYDFQCNADQIVPNSQVCSQVQTECKNSCTYTPSCPEDTKLSVGSAGPICECGVSPALLMQGLTLPYDSGIGKYCCDGSLSDVSCKTNSHIRVYGQITDNQGPVAAEILVDDTLSYFSDASGNYEFFLLPGSHSLTFSKEPAHTPQDKIIQGGAGADRKLDITLPSATENCESPRSPKVPGFRAENVKGKPYALLRWDNTYCNGKGAQSYAIVDNFGKNFSVDGSFGSYEVKGLEWGKDYTFSITAIYTDHKDFRISLPSISEIFNPGDPECEDRYAGEFCLDLTKRRICDPKNKLISNVDSSYYFEDCSLYKSTRTSENDWYCTYESRNPEKTRCVERLQCGYQKLTNPKFKDILIKINLPFLGLLFDDISCSTNDLTKRQTNACYLDSSSKNTDFCFQCPDTQDNNFDCSLYESERSCSRNRCGIPKECEWKPNDFNSFGSGFCVAKESIDRTKKEQLEIKPLSSSCEVCSSTSPLFENVGCTQNVCSSLGLCFEEESDNVPSCSQCVIDESQGKLTTCSDFQSETSCVSATGKNQAHTSFQGVHTFSDDACGIGRCIWDDSRTECFKDGNFDSEPDCFDQFSQKYSYLCEKDYFPPTSIPGFGTVVLSKDLRSNNNDLSFEISEKIKSFNYCMYKEGDSPCIVYEKALASRTTIKDGKTSVSINPISKFYLDLEDTGNYILRYYSEDMFFNVEETKEVSIIIDSQPPNIGVDFKIDCANCDKIIDCSQGEAYLSKVEVSLISNEKVSCTDYFVPPGTSKTGLPGTNPGALTFFAVSGQTPYTSNFALIDHDTHTFGEDDEGLQDGRYRYYVECTDLAGNLRSVEKWVDVDSTKIISSVSPRGSLSNGEFSYEVKTESPASCKLSVDGNEYINLESQDGNVHKKPFTYQANTYHHYSILCNEINPFAQVKSRCDYSVNEFIVDSQPPSTLAYVGREKFNLPEWTLFSSDATEITLDPRDESENDLAFGVNRTVYCLTLGTKCTPGAQGTQSQEIIYPDQIKIPVNSNIGICYHSIDNGGNKENTKCGKVTLVPVPIVRVDTPQDNHVTANPVFKVNGIQTAFVPETITVVVSNGTEERISSISPQTQLGFLTSIIPTDNPFEIDGPILFSGKNSVSVQVKAPGDLLGEDTFNLYLDDIPPEIISTTEKTFEYGSKIKLTSDVTDPEFTTLLTKNNIGNILQLFATLKMPSAGFDQTYPLTQNGKSWTIEVTPVKRGDFYDIIPGTYELTYVASDEFNNVATLKTNLTIEKTIPVNFTAYLDAVQFSEDDTFYTNSKSPQIIVNTKEPGECTVQLLINPPVESKMVSTDSKTHTYSSNLIEFLPDKEQEMSALISCQDSFSTKPQFKNIKIIYDPIKPFVDFISSSGNQEIEKNERFYTLSPRTSTLSLKSNEQIFCVLVCNKQTGLPCGEKDPKIIVDSFDQYINDPTIIGKDPEYAFSQEINIDYSKEKNPYGIYSYEAKCFDKAQNEAELGKLLMNVVDEEYDIIDFGPHIINSVTPEIFVKTNYVSEECTILGEPNKMETPSLGRENEEGQYFSYRFGILHEGVHNVDVTCKRLDGKTTKLNFQLEINLQITPVLTTTPKILPSPNDASPPVITNVQVQSIFGKRGFFEEERKDQYKRVLLVDGENNGEFKFKLIADINEQSQCRYDFRNLSFEKMANSMRLNDDLPKQTYYQETGYLEVSDDKTAALFFISCNDASGNSGKNYEIEIIPDSTFPSVISDVFPRGILNTDAIVLTSITQRDVSCTYTDGVNSNLQMFSKLTPEGYLHTSSRFSSQKIKVSQGEHNEFEIKCSSNDVTESSSKLNFTVDTISPLLSIDSPVLDFSTGDSFVELKGKSEPGVKINIYVNDFLQRTVSVAKSNNSLTEFSTKFYLETPGENRVVIEAEDGAGNQRRTSMKVTTTYNGPKVFSFLPYFSKSSELSKIEAQISGNIDSSSRIVVLNISSDELKNSSGGVLFDNPKFDKSRLVHEIPFKLPNGEYEIEFAIKDLQGKSAFGTFGRFIIEDNIPRHDWENPDAFKNSLSQSTPSAVIKARSINSNRLITKVNSYVGTYLPNLDRISILRKSNSYATTSQLPQGKVYLKTMFEDLGGMSETLRVLNIDTLGPGATITPSGTITTTRPKIKATFLENVKLKSFSLKNKHTKEIQGVSLQGLVEGKEFNFNLATQLRPGTYIFELEAEDSNGNSNRASSEFTTSITGIEIRLISPKYGVGSKGTFDLVFETNQDATCRFSNLDVGDNFDSHAGIFDITGDFMHTKRNFNTRVTYPNIQPVYVICKGALSPTTKPTKFDLSTDTSIPSIKLARAVPNKVTEFPLRTEIQVETNKETICRLDCLGNSDYDSMQISLGPNFAEKHTYQFQVENKKDYSQCKVACQAKSELKTSPSRIDLIVDTDLKTSFDILSPVSGSAFLNKSVPFHISSQKLAQCAFRIGNNSYTNLGVKGREFKGTIGNLTTGKHKFEVECLYSQGTEKKSTDFSVDLTPPINLSISHGGTTCSPYALNITLNADDPESELAGFNYTVKSSGKIVINNTFIEADDKNRGRIRKIKELINGQTYTFVVSALNKAGLSSVIKESSPLSIDGNSSSCNADITKPIITIDQNKSVGKTIVTLSCSDTGKGCSTNKNYGLASSEALCKASSKYVSPVDVTVESFFCYEVYDMAGNIARGSTKILIKEKPVNITPQFGVKVDFDEVIEKTDVKLKCENFNCSEIKYGTSSDFANCNPDKEYASPVSVTTQGTYLCYKATSTNGEVKEKSVKVPIQTQQIQAPIGPEKRPPIWLFASIILVALLVVGIGGYFSYNYFKKPEDISLPKHTGSLTGKPTDIGTQKGITKSKPKSSIQHIPKNKPKDDTKDKLRSELFDKFLTEKEKIERKKKQKEKEKEQKIKSKFDAFEELTKMASQSHKFEKLISKVKSPLKKDEFSELQKLATDKGVSVTKDDFSDLMKLVNKKIKEKKDEK